MYMTLGVDVSILFADMCLLSQFPDLLAKKMIYLYLGNLAEQNQKLALLAVNTFLKELDNKDPKIRGLALRSLCSLKSQFNSVKSKIVEMLQDSDSYVQKIAIYGCLKVYHEDNKFFEEFELIDKFYNMLRSPYPIVAVSVINVLNEVFEKEGGMAINSKIITYLLNRMKEFSDYEQSVIINLAIRYKPKDKQEKIKIMNILDSKVRSIDPNLVISIVKLFLKYNEDEPEIFQQVLERVKDSLLTLIITADQEQKFNLLHHIIEVINIGGGKYFESDYKRFFCDQEEKSFLQDIKLDILFEITTENSFDDVFNEITHYVYESNLFLAKKSIQIIGKLGKKFKERTVSIINLFVMLFEDKKIEMYGEILMALKHIYSSGQIIDGKDQKYIFENFVELIESINQEQHVISVLWIISRFCMQIKKSSYILYKFVQQFSKDQNKSEQFKLQLINTTFYIFLKKPKESLPVLSLLLRTIFSNETQNPFILNKCKFYYQMMENNINKFEKFFVQFFETENFIQLKKNENFDSYQNMNTFSIVYHQPEDYFTKKKEFFIQQRTQSIKEPQNEQEEIEENIQQKSQEEESDSESDSSEEQEQQTKQIQQQQQDDDIDFLDMDLDGNNTNLNNQDDLGIQDIDFEPAQKPKKTKKKKQKKISLTNNELSPQEFQQLWISYQKQKEMQLTFDNDLEDMDDFVQIFEDKQIYCRANQQAGEIMKFYFFCQDQKSQENFLMEIVVESGDEFKMVLKYNQNDDNANQVLDLINEILTQNKFLEQLNLNYQ